MGVMRGRGERGGAAVEFAIVAPVLIIMFLFIFGLGRVASAREAVEGAARDGAREASIARSGGAADSTARQVVNATLVDKKVSCSGGQPSIKVTFGPNGTFQSDGTVTVHVVCDVNNTDVVMSTLKRHSTLSGDFTAWVDKYRGTR